MSDYTQGVCEDGAAILKDGLPMTIEHILTELRGAQDGGEPVAGEMVSVDVSTCDEDVGNRVFGEIIDWQDDGNGERIWLCSLDHYNYQLPTSASVPDSGETTPEGEANAQDGGEPVAWLCVYPDGSAFGAVTEQRSVDVWIRRESDGRTVCPLYTHPPSAEVVKEHERKAHHRGQAEIIERMCQIINGLLDGKFVPRYGLLEPWKTTHERLTERLSSPTSAVVPEWMHGISEGIKTQNNRITADPLFVVFQKHEIVVDEDYDYDRISWGNSDGEADDEVQARLDEMRSDPDSDFFMDNEIELHDEDTGIEDFRRCALKEIEEFVTACFTEAGANDYLAVNGHNLRKPFVYVTSLYRNEEMKRLRGWLMQLPPEQEQE